MTDGATLVVHGIPVVLVGIQLFLVVGRLLQYLQCFTGVGILQQLYGDFRCVTVYLGEEAQPQHHHLLLGDGLRLELRQFHKHKTQPLNDSV